MNDGLAFPFAVSLIFVGLGVDTAVRMMPEAMTQDYFQVNAITAEREGDTAILHVDREIKRPIHMSYTVTVSQKLATGLKSICRYSSGVFQYQPDAELPDKIDLDWWSDGHCKTLPPGEAVIITTWTPAMPGLQPITVKTEVMG